MSRTSKHFGLAALLLALVLAGRGPAQDKNEPPPFPAKTEDQIKWLADRMQDMTNNYKTLITSLNKNTEKFDERLKKLESIVGSKGAPAEETLKIPLLEGDINKLRKDMSDLRSQLDNLQTTYQQLADRVRNQDTRAARAFEPRPLGNTGAIRLQNRSGVSVTVVVDNRGYVLGPYATRLLENRPLGTFTYEVLADTYGVLQDPVTRTLTADEIFVIQINPGR